MPSRIAVLFLALFALAGCAPVAPAPVAQPTHPPLAELRAWTLSADEIAYIRQFRYVTGVSLRSRVQSFGERVDHYEADPSLLADNGLRADLSLSAVGLREAAGFLSAEPPSPRFAWVSGYVETTQAHLNATAAALERAVNETDRAQLAVAQTHLADALAVLEEVESAFAAMLGEGESH